MTEDASLAAVYRTQLPNLGSVASMLGQILDLEALDSFKAIDPVANPLMGYARDRIFANARLLRYRLDAVDPLLLSDPGLSNLVNALSTLLNELRNFVANGNMGHLTQARAQLDSVVYPHLWAIFPENGSGPLDSVQLEAVRRVEAGASKALLDISATQKAALDEVKAKHQETIDQLSTSQAHALASLNQNSTEFAQELSSLKADAKDLTAQVVQQRAENAATIAKFDKDFSASEQARSERFGALLSQQTEDFAARSKSADAGAADLLERLHEQEGRVLQLVEAIGTRGITANYSVIAEEELTAANRWRFVTLGVFGLGVAAACYIFYKFLDAPLDHMNLGEVALRFGFALAITSPAIYTARESARHRTTGDRARQAEMELASLGPFIANLERDSQDSIRRDLVAKYFGRPSEAHSAEPPVKFKEVSDLAVELAKAVRDGADKKK